VDSQASSQFDLIIEAAKQRRGDLNVDTMIVFSHLAQMRTFMLRRGIEFLCDQDSYAARKDFLAKIIEENMLELKFDSIVDYFLCDGQGLFYFRPAGESYQILYFTKDNYRCYRNTQNEIDNVVLIYSFNVKDDDHLGAYPMENSRAGRKKYIRLSVFKDKIEQTVSNERIDFDDENTSRPLANAQNTETVTNSLGFIPAVEVFNHLDCTGQGIGNGEFGWLQNQILYHDELVRNIRKNLKFFGNPTLISSRPKHDIIESGDETSFRPTISSQAGFQAIGRPSTANSGPFGGPSPIDGQIKVPRVIANLEPTDRINYLTPDSVSGDQNKYVKQYRSEIRLALGGVDDIDINTAATAYEIKTLYGRVAATAEKKANALFTYGLCKLLSMMIKNEEYIFLNSFATAIGLQKPVIPLQEDFNQDIEAYDKARAKYEKEYQKYIEQRDETLRATLESGAMPPGVTGLVPDGSTRVSWRWTGDVFEESAQDILNNSIVVRNLQEAGVGSLEALTYLFPNKTEEERAAMLTGYPFRMVQQTQQSLGTFINLLGTLYKIPHPQVPNMPLASDPKLDITGFLYRSLEFLRKELSYSGRYKPSSDEPGPTVLSDADRVRASRGDQPLEQRRYELPGVGPNQPGSGTGPTNPGLPANSGPAGFGTTGQSMAGSVPGTERIPEYQQPIPSPGTQLSISDNPNISGGYPGSVGFDANPSTPIFGSPDIQSPSFNPSFFATGLPNTGAGQRRVSKPNKRRKS
jgi:hypothetical protein